MNSPLLSIGLYRIEYENGMVQECYMVAQKHYDNILNPLKDAAFEAHKQRDHEAGDELKRIYNRLFGDNFFTSESPMARAIVTGMLDNPESQGGPKPCKVTKITTPSQG